MRSKAPLTLMEQMVMLLVFALAAALCLQAFVLSDSISRRDEDRDRAVVLCQSAAEVIQYCGGVANAAQNPENHWLSTLGPVNAADGRMAVYYDGDWNGAGNDLASTPDAAITNPPAGAVYRLMAEEMSSDVPGLGKARISVTETDTGAVLFELEIAWQEVSEHG